MARKFLESVAALRRAIEANLPNLSVTVYRCGSVAHSERDADKLYNEWHASKEIGYPKSIEMDEKTLELRLTMVMYSQIQLAQDPDGNNEEPTVDKKTLVWSPLHHKQLFTEATRRDYDCTVFVSQLAPDFDLRTITEDSDEDTTPPTTHEAPEEITVYLKQSENCIISAYSRATARSRTLLNRTNGPTILHVVIE
jgi:hypothetical protein